MALSENADIPLCLMELGLGTENWGPTTDTYENLSANWAGTSPCPTEEEMENAWEIVNARRQMAKMRDERNARIAAIEWRISRYKSQIDGNLTPTESSSKIEEIYQYMQDLRDMPQDNPNVEDEDDYNALVWPIVPSLTSSSSSSSSQ